MEHPDLLSELALIERALQPEQFRFLVVQYNHAQALARLKERLRAAFSDRSWTELDGKTDGPQAILTLLQQPPEGLLLIHRAEALLEDEGFTRSLNQRRDALSRHPLGLILLLPTGGDYLHRLARAMPDLWSLRNLVAELHLAPAPGLDSQFITLTGQSYFSFSSQAEAQAELDSLHTRIGELQTLPGNRPLLTLLLTRQGKIQLQLSDYTAAEASFFQALALAREVGDQALEATTLTELGEVLAQRGDYEAAFQYLEQSLRIQREIGDKRGEGSTLSNISHIYDARGDHETALNYLKQSLEIQRAIGDMRGEGTTLNSLATTAHARGDYATALRYLEQSLDIRREIGDKSGEGITLNNLSQIFKARGDYETAREYLEQSLRIRREIGNKSGEGTTLNNLSGIYRARGDYATALRYLEQSLVIRREIGDKAGIGQSLNNLSQIFKTRGDYATALSYLEQSLAIMREIGDINGLATTLNNMAVIVFQQQGKPEEAIPMFMESYQMFKQIGSPDERIPMEHLEDIKQQIGEARYQEILQAFSAS